MTFLTLPLLNNPFCNGYFGICPPFQCMNPFASTITAAFTYSGFFCCCRIIRDIKIIVQHSAAEVSMVIHLDSPQRYQWHHHIVKYFSINHTVYHSAKSRGSTPPIQILFNLNFNNIKRPFVTPHAERLHPLPQLPPGPHSFKSIVLQI